MCREVHRIVDSMTIWRLFCNRQDKIWMKSTTFSQIKKIQSTNFGQKRVQSTKDFWPNLQSTDKLPPPIWVGKGEGDNCQKL